MARRHIVRSGAGAGTVLRLMCCLNFSTAIRTASGTGSLNEWARFDLATAGADLTIQLPAPAFNGVFGVLIVGPNNGWKLTVNRYLAENIVQPTTKTGTSYDLISDGEVALFKSDGTDWYLVG